MEKWTKVIYVAGKYSGDTWYKIDNNIRIAKKAALKLWRMGWAVVCPHANSGHFDDFEIDDSLSYESWITGDLAIMKNCDAVFMLEEWEESKGAVGERKKAISWNIPVFHETEGYPKPEDLRNY